MFNVLNISRGGGKQVSTVSNVSRRGVTNVQCFKGFTEGAKQASTVSNVSRRGGRQVSHVSNVSLRGVNKCLQCQMFHGGG